MDNGSSDPTELTAGDYTITPNQTIKLYGENENGFKDNKLKIVKAGTNATTCSLGGNIMALIYGKDVTDQEELVIPSDCNFKEMFNLSNTLTVVSSDFLPATTLSDECYRSLFQQSSITNSPVLPANDLTTRCYDGMFSSCRALVEAPDLPATALTTACYQDMFNYCTALKKPSIISATSLQSNSCANMFRYDSALKINNTGSGTKMFTCPDTAGLTIPTSNMFNGTGETYTDSPSLGVVCYYTID